VEQAGGFLKRPARDEEAATSLGKPVDARDLVAEVARHARMAASNSGSTGS
jgi:hypothetical protein